MASNVRNQKGLKSCPCLWGRLWVILRNHLLGWSTMLSIIYRTFVWCLLCTIFLTSVPHAWADWVSIKANFVGFHNAEGASTYTWQFPQLREEQVPPREAVAGEGKEALGASERYHIHVFISGHLWCDSGLFLWYVTKRKSREGLGLLRNTSNNPYGDLPKNQTLSPMSKT